MKNLRILALLLLVATGWTGCKTEPLVEPDPATFGYDYYPLEQDQYRIYNVTNIRYMNNVADTTRFQTRERVDTVYTDKSNTTVYKIIRSVRSGAGSLWADDSVMLVMRQNNSIVEMKNNVKRIKLVFPVKDEKAWVADAYNSNEVNYGDGKERYKLTDVGKPFTIKDKVYPESLTIIQGQPTDNVINKDERKEVYAKNIGLVYRYFNKITYCNNPQNCPIDQKFKLNGHERIEILTSHGKL